MNEPHVMPTDARYPLTLARGAGARVWDDAGRELLEFAGALGVTAIGHSHPGWVEAVRGQLDTLDRVSKPVRERAAGGARRPARHPDARARGARLLLQSGAEANEEAVKLAGKHGLATGKTAIVALEGSFHGRTIATLAATGQPEKRSAFEPLVDWFRFVPPADLDALDAAMTAAGQATA